MAANLKPLLRPDQLRLWFADQTDFAVRDVLSCSLGPIASAAVCQTVVMDRVLHPVDAWIGRFVRCHSGATRGLQGGVGVITVAIGGMTVYAMAPW